MNNIVTIIIMVLLIALVGYIIFIFNKISKASNSNIQALRELDVILKKRLNLIPNLKEMIKGYTKIEKITLEDIDSIKDRLSVKMTVYNRQKEEDKFSAIIKDIVVSLEDYPELKQSPNFLQFHDELVVIEKEIEKSRRHYNDTNRNYNALIKKFPNNILASILGYNKRAFFEVDLLTKEEVTINFVDRRKADR